MSGNPKMAPAGRVPLDERLDLLAEAGIDLQILCSGASQPYVDNREEAVAVARFAMAEGVIRKNPTCAAQAGLRCPAHNNLGCGSRTHHLRTSPSRTLLGNEQTAMKRNLVRKK